MPKFKVRMWYQYEETFIIEAEDAESAEEIAFDVYPEDCEEFMRYDEQLEDHEVFEVNE